jgi:hypothetical protein
MLFNIYTISTLLLRKKVYENILHRGMESTITKKNSGIKQGFFDNAKSDNVPSPENKDMYSQPDREGRYYPNIHTTPPVFASGSDDEEKPLNDSRVTKSENVQGFTPSANIENHPNLDFADSSTWHSTSTFTPSAHLGEPPTIASIQINENYTSNATPVKTRARPQKPDQEEIQSDPIPFRDTSQEWPPIDIPKVRELPFLNAVNHAKDFIVDKVTSIKDNLQQRVQRMVDTNPQGTTTLVKEVVTETDSQLLDKVIDSANEIQTRNRTALEKLTSRSEKGNEWVNPDNRPDAPIAFESPTFNTEILALDILCKKITRDAEELSTRLGYQIEKSVELTSKWEKLKTDLDNYLKTLDSSKMKKLLTYGACISTVIYFTYQMGLYRKLPDFALSLASHIPLPSFNSSIENLPKSIPAPSMSNTLHELANIPLTPLTIITGVGVFVTGLAMLRVSLWVVINICNK